MLAVPKQGHAQFIWPFGNITPLKICKNYKFLIKFRLKLKKKHNWVLILNLNFNISNKKLMASDRQDGIITARNEISTS